MKVTAQLNNIRIAPRKSRLVARLVKGMNVSEALGQLDVNVKKTSSFMVKLILSAVANGENNFGLDKNNLYVYEVLVGEGPVMKRWMPKAFGRAGRILKRTSKIKLTLEERVEGKGRKTKEEMDKEKKKRLEDKKKQLKEMSEEKETKNEPKTGKTEKIESSKKVENSQKESKNKWGEKIFRRKSM
jgi:large subunit ribosomal protein L22